MRYLIGVIFAAVLIVSAYYFFLPLLVPEIPGKPLSAPVIKLGFIGPLSGDFAALAQPIKNAVSLAIKDLKTQGRLIEIVFADGRCDGETAIAALNNLINVEQISLVIGGVCSGETIAMAPLADFSQTIVFSPSASGADISHSGDFVFRNSPADAQSGFFLAEELGKKFKNVALISESPEAVQVLRRIFIDRFTELGGEIVLDAVYPPDVKERDLKDLARKRLKEATTTEAILLNSQNEQNAAFLVKQIRALKIKWPIYGPPLLGSPRFSELAGKEASGIIYADLPSLDRSQIRVQAFLNDYQKFFGPAPLEDFFLGTAYDAVGILAQAAAKAGNDPVKIRDYLYNLPEYDGLAGRYSFDLNGDVVGIKFILKEIK